MKVRKRLLLASGIFAALAVLVIILYSLRITGITYVGSTRYTEEELNGQIFDKSYSLNPVYCLWESRYGKKKSIPFIQTYDIEFKGWNQITVRVYEKSVVGYVDYKGYRMYFDKDGIVVESSREALEDVVEVTGLSFSHMILYQKLPVEKDDIFRFILNLTQMLIKYELPADRIEFDTSGKVTVCIGDIRFQIGEDRYLNEKVARISDLLPETEGLSGSFFMEDVTEDTDTFRFEKSSEN